jgi:hypothetical protein
VIAAAALCPAAPLMATELTGDDPTAAAVRAAASEAAARLVASGVGLVAVVAAGEVTREWPATGRADLAPYGGPRLVDAQAVPLGVGLGARLLDAAGHTGDRRLWTVGPAEAPDLSAVDGLLVMADGSAHRNLKTSTDLAQRAERFDALVEKSIVDGELSTMDAFEPDGLMVTGFPALRVLAKALPNAHTDLLYCAAPFGVGYFVAAFTPRT